jgi:HK97 family phage major capsid protein
MASGNISIMYGDFSGLAVKISEDIAIDVLREAYAEQHAVCLLAWTEMDAKIENDEKIAVLKHA